MYNKLYLATSKPSRNINKFNFNQLLSCSFQFRFNQLLSFNFNQLQSASKLLRSASFAVDDCVGIEFESLNRKIYCVCVYRSTALSDAQNNLLLMELNKLPINDESELIIVGDFNLPDVNWFSGNLKVCSDTTDRNLLIQLTFMDLFVQKGLTWHIKDQITRRRLVNGCL